MQDALSAQLTGAALTGNGRRESYACIPMPRMTNTFMLPGTSTHEEIIRSVELLSRARERNSGRDHRVSEKRIVLDRADRIRCRHCFRKLQHGSGRLVDRER